MTNSTDNIIHVIEILNPLDPGSAKRESIAYQPGKSLEQLYPSLLLKAEFVFSLNGKIIENKEEAFPQAGDSIVLCPVLTGGSGGGKSILRMVAMIAVAMVAPYATTAMLGINGAAALGTAGVAMVTAGITMAGGMLVNAMIPPPKAASAGGDSNTDTASYGIDGPKNVSADGIVVPVVYGTHRYGGNLINAYVTNDESDSQFLHLLFNCGEGPIAGINSIELNDTPIENFKDYQVETRLGEADQSPISFFQNQVVPKSVSQELTESWIYKTTDNEVDQLRFDFVFGNGLYGMSETSSASFSLGVDIEAQYRMVGASQWMAAGAIADVREYTDVPEWIKFSSGRLWAAAGRAAYAPTGAEVLRGREYFGPIGSEYENVKVGNLIQVPVFSSTYNVTANKRTAVRRSFYTPILPEGSYEVRVRRKNKAAEAPSGKVYVDQVVWSDINQIVHEAISYKHTALLGIRIRLTDQLSGLPTVTHMNGGRIVRVWDATAGEWRDRPSSNPAWISLDALTNKRYGAGQAFARFDIQRWMDWAAHCDANNLQFNGVFDTQGNAWDAMGDVFRCGHAGRTNVGTRNSVVIERPSAPRMMFSVANMLQGSFKQSWLPASDRVNEIDATYADKDDGYRTKTMRVVDRVSAAAGRPARSTSINFFGLTTADEVWRDANILLNYNRLLLQTVEWSSPIEAIACVPGDVVTVQHDMPAWSLAGRLGAGSTQSTIVLDRPVAMSPGRSYSALLHMSAVKRFTGTVNFVQGTAIFPLGFDGAMNVKRAKVAGKDIEIESVIQQGNTYGVILTSVEGIAAGMPVELWDTDALESRNVVNPSVTPDQEFTTLQLALPLPSAPEQYTQWMFGLVNRVGKPFTIKAITGTHDYRRDISAIEYSPDVFQAGPAPAMPNYSDLERYVKHVTITGCDEEVFMSGTSTKSRVTVEFEGSGNSYYSSAIYMNRNGSGEMKVGDGPRSFTVEGAAGDELVFRVVARDAFQRSAPHSTAPTFAYQIKGRTQLPNDATGLTASVGTDAWYAEWDPSIDPDVNASELRIGDSWATGRLLFRGDATSCRFDFLPAGTHELRLRHCIGQSDGLYSGEDCIKTIVVLPPDQPLVRGEVNSRTISLDWQDCSKTQTLAGYDIQLGPTAETRVSIGSSGTGRTFQRIEESMGLRRYWVTAVDAAGNRSAPGSIELETLPTIDEAIGELQLGLEEQIADLVAAGEANSLTLQAEIVAQGEALVAESIARGEAITAEADSRSAAIAAEQAARISADSSEVAARQALSSKVTGVDNPASATLAALSSGLLYEERQARTTADSAEVTARQALAATVTSNKTTTDAAITAEQTVRANADSANATAISNVSSSVDGLTAAVATEVSTRATQTGQLFAKYSLTLSAGGKIAGYQINNGSTGASSFVILADKFAFALEANGTTKYPFVAGLVGGSPTVGVDGNLMVDGTIKTRALEAESVTADKIKAKSIGANQIAAGSITTDLLNVGVGANILKDSFLVTRDSWLFWSQDSGGSNNSNFGMYINSRGADWKPTEGNVLVLEQNSDWSASPSFGSSHRIPAVPGQRYEFSVYTAAHRCNVTAYIDFHDSNGNWIHAGGGGNNLEEALGGRLLSGYKRVYGFGVAPANAASVQLILKKDGTRSGFGYTNSVAFFTQPMVAVASVNQTHPSPYSPSGLGTRISGAGIETPSLASISPNMGVVVYGKLQSADGKFVIDLDNKFISITV